MTYIQEKSDDTGDMTMEQMMSDAFGNGTSDGFSNGYDTGMMNVDDDADMVGGSPEDIIKMKILKQIEGGKFHGQNLVVAAVAKLPARHAWAKAQRYGRIILLCYWNSHFLPSHQADALQQNREQVAQASFEIWTTEVGIGVKNTSSDCFEIFVFLHTLICFLSPPCNF